jgi:hypothetical protein
MRSKKALIAFSRTLAGQYFGGLGTIRRSPERSVAGADHLRARDDQCSSRRGDPLSPYAPGGVFDPLFAGLLVDAGIRAATLGRFGSPYARSSKPAAPTVW